MSLISQADLDQRSMARDDAIPVVLGDLSLKINPAVYKARKLLASLRRMGEPVDGDAYALAAVRLRDAWADFDRGDGPEPLMADAIDLCAMAIRASYRDVTDLQLDAAPWFTTDAVWPLVHAAWGLGKKKAGPSGVS